MLYDLYQREMSRFDHPYQTTHMRLKTIDVEEQGILVKRSRFVEYNPADEDKQYKVSDFEIGNILAVGAFQMLKPVMMHNIDFAGSANAFDLLYLKLNEYEKSAEQAS